MKRNKKTTNHNLKKQKYWLNIQVNLILSMRNSIKLSNILFQYLKNQSNENEQHTTSLRSCHLSNTIKKNKLDNSKRTKFKVTQTRSTEIIKAHDKPFIVNFGMINAWLYSYDV